MLSDLEPLFVLAKISLTDVPTPSAVASKEWGRGPSTAMLEEKRDE